MNSRSDDTIDAAQGVAVPRRRLPRRSPGVLGGPHRGARRRGRALPSRTDLIDTNNIRCRWQDDVNTGECRFDCFDPVIDLSDACERAARDPALLEIVGALYGEPACLFKDKLIFKPAGTLGYKLHQDYISWKSFPTTFLTVIVAIDAADAENGATEVFPGYHRQGCLTPRDGMYHQLPDDAVDPLDGGRARPRAGRRRDLQRLHAASLRGEPLVAGPPAALSELQRPQRRRRAARPALRGVPWLAPGSIRRVREDLDVLPVMTEATTSAAEASARRSSRASVGRLDQRRRRGGDHAGDAAGANAGARIDHRADAAGSAARSRDLREHQSLGHAARRGHLPADSAACSIGSACAARRSR